MVHRSNRIWPENPFSIANQNWKYNLASTCNWRNSTTVSRIYRKDLFNFMLWVPHLDTVSVSQVFMKGISHLSVKSPEMNSYCQSDNWKWCFSYVTVSFKWNSFGGHVLGMKFLPKGQVTVLEFLQIGKILELEFLSGFLLTMWTKFHLRSHLLQLKFQAASKPLKNSSPNQSSVAT